MTIDQVAKGRVTAEAISLGFRAPVETTLLCEVKFDVAEGAFVGLVGPSGCGKTSLLLCLAGLFAPLSGKILVQDIDLYNTTKAQRRDLLARSIGLIPQQPHLVRHANALDNVLLGGLGAGNHSKRERRSRALELMAEPGVGELAKRYPSELSGGQSQRVCVARALMADPAIVLADEPTASVSGDAAQRVLNCLESRSHTTIVATHDPAVIERTETSLKVTHWQHPSVAESP